MKVIEEEENNEVLTSNNSQVEDSVCDPKNFRALTIKENNMLKFVTG